MSGRPAANARCTGPDVTDLQESQSNATVQQSLTGNG